MRWTAARKAELLARIEREPEATAEIMAEHNLSAEELTEWMRGRARAGHAGMTISSLDRRPGVVKRGAA